MVIPKERWFGVFLAKLLVNIAGPTKKPPGRYAERLSRATAGPALLRFRRICA
jgi:hypothetical protein